MKHVSVKLFFAVLCKGIRQCFASVMRLFGYKREGTFAHCVWGLFAVSAAIITAVFAAIVCYGAWQCLIEEGVIKGECNYRNCYYDKAISPFLVFHEHQDGTGHVVDQRNGGKILKNVAWIAKPDGEDSLVCFSNGKKRGYFNKMSGEVVIQPQYNHAWIFSDGLACVEVDGNVKFIDVTGKTILDTKIPFVPNTEGYVFHNGYCVVPSANGEFFGMIDKTGTYILPTEYTSIIKNDSLWIVKKGGQMAVMNQTMAPIIPLSECDITVLEDGFEVVLPDHTIRKYDLNGHLINSFYIVCVNTLEYDKDEIVYQKEVTEILDDERVVESTSSMEPYHPRATARLKSYQAGHGYEGLMTADGHIVTLPIYYQIKAVGQDLYMCGDKNNNYVIVNGKGEIVK